MNMYVELFLGVVLVIMALTSFTYLFRCVIGPMAFDRILAINSLGTIIILMICIIAVLQGESYIIDVALIYAMLSFVTVVILCKSYLTSHKKEREDDFENLKKGVNEND